MLFLDQVESIRHALDALLLHHGRGAPLTACVGERDQVSSKVPTVNRGYVLRIERTQLTGIVPIEEVAPVPR